MDLQLSGKRALVSGGSRGIGKAVARALAADGVDLALLARDGARPAEAAPALGGGIDILVDVAAEAAGYAPPSKLEEITAERVADVVLFLASPRSRAIHGDAIAAGGGAPRAIHC